MTGMGGKVKHHIRELPEPHWVAQQDPRRSWPSCTWPGVHCSSTLASALGLGSEQASATALPSLSFKGCPYSPILSVAMTGFRSTHTPS